ncbi:MAG: hypothetical protein F4236_09135, partial [Acidimicrobiia bacterium]|nr:hypothetical protein [Acidimicrobiia bacterium]
MTAQMTFDYAARRAELGAILTSEGVDLAWLPTGGDLEYLTGLQRRVPTFGDVNYTHGWVAGAFILPGRDPIFLLPRNFVEFDLPDGVPGEVISVDEMDDGDALFAQAAAALGPAERIAVGARTWGSAIMRLLAAFGGAELVDASRLVNRMRRIKTPEELGLMKRACLLADNAMAEVS